MLIREVRADEYGLLSELAVSAKRHWGYPERWMEIWTPQLIFAYDYFEEHEGWAAIDD